MLIRNHVRILMLPTSSGALYCGRLKSGQESGISFYRIPIVVHVAGRSAREEELSRRQKDRGILKSHF